MPVLPSWLCEPLWDQFATLIPERPTYDPSHPLGCHRPRISDRIVFDKLLQVCGSAVPARRSRLKYLQGKGCGWEQVDDYWRVVRIHSYDNVVHLGNAGK
jgi:hypothetical protein